MGFNDRPQALAKNMGIDLSCRDIGMSQHLLDTPQIRAVVKQMGRESVAQDMGR